MEHKKDKGHLKAFLMILIVVTDTLVTVYLITMGATEANPMLNWYLSKTNLECMAITKIIGSLLLVLFIVKKGKDFTKHLNWGIPLYAFILISAAVIQFWITRQ